MCTLIEHIERAERAMAIDVGKLTVRIEFENDAAIDKLAERIAHHLAEKPRTFVRDTQSGQFTTSADAEQRPGTTETEHR